VADEPVNQPLLIEGRRVVPRHEDRQPFRDQGGEDLGGAVDRSVIDDRQAIEQREIVTDERFDDVRSVADKRRGDEAHGA